jgi:acyl carrier protein
LNEEQTLQASAAGLEQWDSLATVNLLALIEEEFGVSIDLDELEAPSFKNFLRLIESATDGQVR